MKLNIVLVMDLSKSLKQLAIIMFTTVPARQFKVFALLKWLLACFLHAE